MSKIWRMIEALIREAKQYRGDTGLTFKSIDELMQGNEFRDGITGNPANPKGEAVDCEYKFDPGLWGKWYPSAEPALSIASTDNDTTNQHAGKPQGSMTFKQNWGGKVVNAPGKARTDFERNPSAMDRYDILMQGEVSEVTNRAGKVKKVGVLHRVAYAPSIGSADERRARLQALMSGQTPADTRRPQPHRPEPTKADLAKWTNPKAQPVARQGQNIRVGDGEDEKQAGGGGSSTNNADFQNFLSKHVSSYKPQTPQNPDARDKARGVSDDDDERLFPRRK